ncbi:MAG: tetratricopeptide repeat protein [Armatimonadota bacterium]
MNARRPKALYKVRSAIAAFESGDLQSARDRLCEALDLDHECTDARLWLGYVYEQENEPTQALRQYRVGLVFDPDNPRLIQAAHAAEVSALYGHTPEQRELRDSRRRRISNLIFAAMIPPAGFVMGLWQVVTGRTTQWRALGAKTLLFAVIGAAGYFALLVLMALMMGRI